MADGGGLIFLMKPLHSTGLGLADKSGVAGISIRQQPQTSYGALAMSFGHFLWMDCKQLLFHENIFEF